MENNELKFEEKCGKDVRCYDYLRRPCIRMKGHEGGCNPFSNDEDRQQSMKKKDDTG